MTLDPRHDRNTSTAPAEGVVVEFEPERVVAYRFPAGQPLWPESDLRFEIRPVGDGSALVFGQRLGSAVVFADVDQPGGPGTFRPAHAQAGSAFLYGLPTFLAGGDLHGYDDWDDILPALTAKYREMIVARSPAAT